jgi:hypothetical protein
MSIPNRVPESRKITNLNDSTTIYYSTSLDD